MFMLNVIDLQISKYQLHHVETTTAVIGLSSVVWFDSASPDWDQF